MGAALNSNHVNYLIWRYLQEQGYGKAAVQLSRDWQFDSPQSLPFSNNVSHYTLVKMLQDALIYDQLAVDACKTQDRTVDQDGDAQQSGGFLQSSRRWTFVDTPESRLAEHTFTPPSVSPSDGGEHKRKRQRRETIDGQRPSTLRRRSLRPAEQPLELPHYVTDIDQDIDPPEEDEAESGTQTPVKEEPPPPLPTHTLDIGQSTGVQSEPSVDPTLSTTIATHVLPDTEIYRIQWVPEDSMSLIVTGGSVCHTLRLGARPSLEDTLTETGELKAQSPPGGLIAAPNLQQCNSVTRYSIMHWERSRSTRHVAAAIEELLDNGSTRGRIKVFQADCEIDLAEAPSVVLALRWNESSARLLATWDSIDSDQSFITTWDIASSKPTGKILTSRTIRDAAWLRENTFACCGDQILDMYAVEAGQLKMTQSIETDRPWEELKYDGISRMLACTSSNDGEVGLFDTEENVLQTKDAHEDAITSIEWQPRPDAAADIDEAEVRLLATACTDGTVKLWNARRALECLHTFAAGPVMPVWALSFAPDGSKLAAVIGDQIRVWEAKVNGRLIARWSDSEDEESKSEPNGDNCSAVPVKGVDEGENTQPTDAEEDEENLPPVYSLAWDGLGQRLAVTHGTRISVVQLPLAQNKSSESQQEHQQKQSDDDMT